MYKCCIVQYGRTNPIRRYSINAYELANRTCERDLGVVFDNRLSFQSHIDYITTKARRLVGLMLHSFSSRSASVILPVYKTMIRPILEYASSVWSPYLLKQIKQLKSIQRYVTKRVHGCFSFTYSQRLSALQLSSLLDRRAYFDLLEVYKIINGFSEASVQVNFANSNTRGHSFRLYQCKFKLDIRKFALFVRVSNSWNKLPAEIAETKQLTLFKLRLRRHLQIT